MTTTGVDPDGLDLHTPGAKADEGKLLAGLVLADFAKALEAVCEVGTYGASKYSKSGWLSVRDAVARYEDARVRHQLRRYAGEALDAESGLAHLAHEAWCCLALLELSLRKDGL